MRTWVEKLANAIEKEGFYIKPDEHWLGGRMRFSIYDVRIFEATDGYELDIKNIVSLKYSVIKLYEDEYDLIKKACQKAKQNTEDVIINELNDLN